jgi:pimeloyl-ACP methyl ester carboxylesterase
MGPLMPTVSAAGTTIRYDSRGTRGPVLVLVHGSGGNAAVWHPQIDALADIARVFALDLPGHGGSDGSFATIDDAVAVVRGFVDALGLGNVVIGGHSMGGAIAQGFVLAAPHRTAGVALIGTGARLRVLPKIIQTLEQDHRAGVQFLIELAVAASAPEPLKRAVLEETMRAPARSLIADFRACDRFDVMARLGEIRAPTLVVTGIEDRLTPRKYAEYLAKHIAGAQLALVPGAGHYVQLERPDDVSSALRAFVLERVRG